jgi:hypothetical protein
MAGLLIALWYAAAAMKTLAAYRLVRTGLFRRYPTLLALFIASAADHLVLISMIHHPQGARLWYSVVSPLMFLLDGSAVIGVFWVALEGFPQLRKPGVALLSAVALLAGLAAYWTRAVAIPASGWSLAWQAAILLQRHTGLVLIAILTATRFLISGLSYTPIRPSAKRAADILMAQAVAVIWGVPVFTVATGAQYPEIAQILPLLGGIVAAGLCAALLTAESDRLPARKLVRGASGSDASRRAIDLELAGFRRLARTTLIGAATVRERKL